MKKALLKPDAASLDAALSRFKEDSTGLLGKAADTIVSIDPEKTVPYRNRTTIIHEERILELLPGVTDHGIEQPAIVRIDREQKGFYEIIAGHHRRELAIRAKVPLPCIVRELDDNAADILAVDSNIQGSWKDMLPSEIARSLKLKYEAVKRQGKRSDLLSEEELDTSGTKYQKCGKWDLNSKQARKYVRIGGMNGGLLDLMDKKTIAVNAAYLISFLEEAEQALLLAVLASGTQYQRLNEKTAARLREKSGSLDQAAIMEILRGEPPSHEKTVKIRFDRISRFFSDGEKPEEIEDRIMKALACYAENTQREGGR